MSGDGGGGRCRKRQCALPRRAELAARKRTEVADRLPGAASMTWRRSGDDMAITPRDLAKAKGLGLTLAAGSRGADRQVTWAHAIELADPTPYLSGGELVMTTGINIGH